jgi:hypothetical protein
MMMMQIEDLAPSPPRRSEAFSVNITSTIPVRTRILSMTGLVSFFRLFADAGAARLHRTSTSTNSTYS